MDTRCRRMMRTIPDRAAAGPGRVYAIRKQGRVNAERLSILLNNYDRVFVVQFLPRDTGNARISPVQPAATQLLVPAVGAGSAAGDELVRARYQLPSELPVGPESGSSRRPGDRAGGW